MVANLMPLFIVFINLRLLHLLLIIKHMLVFIAMSFTNPIFIITITMVIIIIVIITIMTIIVINYHY